MCTNCNLRLYCTVSRFIPRLRPGLHQLSWCDCFVWQFPWVWVSSSAPGDVGPCGWTAAHCDRSAQGLHEGAGWGREGGGLAETASILSALSGGLLFTTLLTGENSGTVSNKYITFSYMDTHTHRGVFLYWDNWAIQNVMQRQCQLIENRLFFHLDMYWIDNWHPLYISKCDFSSSWPARNSLNLSCDHFKLWHRALQAMDFVLFLCLPVILNVVPFLDWDGWIQRKRENER